MAKYKTKDGTDVVIPGVGVTVDGVIETNQRLESPVLELVDGSPAPVAPAPVAPTAAVPTVVVTTSETKEQQ